MNTRNGKIIADDRAQLRNVIRVLEAKIHNTAGHIDALRAEVFSLKLENNRLKLVIEQYRNPHPMLIRKPMP